MKNLPLILIFLLASNLSLAQQSYSMKYKLFTTTDNKSAGSSTLGDTFLNNMVYNFECNNSVLFLKNVETLTDDGIKTEISGEENIYVYYDLGFQYKINTPEIWRYKKMKFIKSPDASSKILGFETTKYNSQDKNFIIYTTKQLPWYVQPAIFDYNQVNEAVVKFVNLKSGYGYELASYEKINPDANFKTVLNIKEQAKVKLVGEVVCPFFN